MLNTGKLCFYIRDVKYSTTNMTWSLHCFSLNFIQ